jgi:DNA helicase-2/ATP-dependent DNA helicase PcrA
MSQELLQNLNKAQQTAVQALEGPTLVLAGPGSGKTRVLTHRIAYMIGQANIDSEQILAVTFTNKAAREMRERLDALLGSGPAGALTVGTFHSICTRFLRRDIVHLGRERDFTIYDSDDQQRLMKRVLRDLNLDDKKNSPRAIHSEISRAKNELVSPEEFAKLGRTYRDELVARCYKHYQKLLLEANALDFDDLLVETVRLFEQHPDVLNKYQERYRYILADEYQDTNRVQYVLLKLLAGKYRNIFVVGDEDQSVYAFRGADIRNIRSFEDDYPEAKVVLLEQNYRSTQSILDVAQAVIRADSRRKHVKKLWTDNGAGLQVQLREAFDQDEEGQIVADEISRLIESGKYSAGDMAVLYRTNAQSRAVEEALIKRGLPYQIVGGTRFYERKEIKDVLAYLRVIFNPYDTVNFGRILNWPTRGIGDRSEAELNRWAAQMSVPPYVALQLYCSQFQPDAEALIGPTPPNFAGRIQKAMITFLGLLDELIAARHTHTLADLIEMLFSRLDLEQVLENEYGVEESRDRINNVNELLNVANNYINMPQEAQLATFLEEIALVSDLDTLKETQDAVTCITLHQAKGLEYPVVFLLGLEEGLLPHSRSLDERDALEEERRLFYVGATRAKQQLHLLYAYRRLNFGRTASATPSRFLADIPKDLLKLGPKRSSGDFQSSMFTSRNPVGTRRVTPQAQPSAEGKANRPSTMVGKPERKIQSSDTKFTAGRKVRHSLFGEGIVVSSKPIEGDEEVTVAFSGKGVKRLLASFANLEIAD